MRPDPNDISEINKPKRYDRTPDYELVVPQLAKPQGVFQAFDGAAAVGGRRLLPPRQDHRRRSASRITWRFTGTQAAQVTVANGPRGFSSVYWGRRSGQLHASRRRCAGTYRLTCLVHPTTMAETLVVK